MNNNRSFVICTTTVMITIIDRKAKQQIQIAPRNPRINLDYDTRLMYKHCNRNLFYYYKHTDHAIIYILVVLVLVNLNTLHSTATFLQISYSEVTWRDLYIMYLCYVVL